MPTGADQERRRSSTTCIFQDLERKNMDLAPKPSGDKEMGEVPSPHLVSGDGSDPDSALNQTKSSSKTNDNDFHYGGNLADSSAVSTVSIGEMCKICHCSGEANVSLIAPCYCSGSLKYVHQECLQRWIKSSDIKRCELCKYPFAMQAKVKPFCQWEKLDMTALERRKLFCSVTFHVVAITCVVWSLYVLIDRTAEEIRNGELQWPFWTKLVVVAIGFTGGLVFMYIQCKVYVHLCRKWKAYNRTILVQDAPEGVHKPSDRDRQLLSTPNASKSPNPVATSHLDSASSRRSSSAPSSSLGAPPPLTSMVNVTNSPREANSAAPTLTEKTNAETQTALRGVAILEGGCGHTHTSFGHFSGSSPRVHEGAMFFTECECNLRSKKSKDATPTLTNSSSISGNLASGRGRASKQSTSTPNVHHSTKIKSEPRSGVASSRPSRKLSLSPLRRSQAENLPGSPDVEELDRGSGSGGSRGYGVSHTVLSPVKKA